MAQLNNNRYFYLDIITFCMELDLPVVNFNKYNPGGTSSTFIDADADLEFDDNFKYFTLCPLWLNNSIRQQIGRAHV